MSLTSRERARGSLGSGETIVRSRNSDGRPGRPLPGDYINAVDASRRLRIGRCPPPSLLAVRSDGRMECHVGTLACSKPRRYDYRKHSLSSLLLSPYGGERIFHASRTEVERWRRVPAKVTDLRTGARPRGRRAREHVLVIPTIRGSHVATIRVAILQRASVPFHAARTSLPSIVAPEGAFTYFPRR